MIHGDTSHSPKLEHLGLEPSLQEVLGLEGEHVVETHAGVVEHTDTDETADQGVALEQALGVLIVELEEVTGGTTDLRGSESEGISGGDAEMRARLDSPWTG